MFVQSLELAKGELRRKEAQLVTCMERRTDAYHDWRALHDRAPPRGPFATAGAVPPSASGGRPAYPAHRPKARVVPGSYGSNCCGAPSRGPLAMAGAVMPSAPGGEQRNTGTRPKESSLLQQQWQAVRSKKNQQSEQQENVLVVKQ